MPGFCVFFAPPRPQNCLVTLLHPRLSQPSVSGALLGADRGSLMYVVGLAPLDEAGVYRNAFSRVLESIQIIR